MEHEKRMLIEKWNKNFNQRKRNLKMTRLIITTTKKKIIRSARVALEAISYHPGRLCNNQPLNVLNGLKGHFSPSTILHNSLQTQYKNHWNIWLSITCWGINASFLIGFLDNTEHFYITDLHINVSAYGAQWEIFEHKLDPTAEIDLPKKCLHCFQDFFWAIVENEDET